MAFNLFLDGGTVNYIYRNAWLVVDGWVTSNLLFTLTHTHFYKYSHNLKLSGKDIIMIFEHEVYFSV